jgi:uncharacterized membrane protein
MTLWYALAAWHLYPAGLVTATGHLIDPSTTDPHGYNVWAYKHLAYSDIYRLYAERGLASHPFPYVHVRIEYPVVTGLYMWLMSFFPGANGDFIASAVGLWLAGVVALYALRRVVPASYHWFALTPLVFVFALLNWDVLAIALLAIGLWMASERRWARAGLAFALGTCAKLFPVVYVPFLAVRLYREDRGALRRFLGVFFAVLVVVNAPFAVANFRNWSFFFSFNDSRGNESISGSALLSWISSNVSVDNAVIGVALLTVIALGLRSVARGASVERWAAWTFVVFLLLNKVYSPQYTLWLFVFALAAGWPGWTLLVLSGTGVVDYSMTFATLYVTNASVAPNAASTWWATTVAPWIARGRDLAVAACGLAATLVPPASAPAFAAVPARSSVAEQLGEPRGDALISTATGD